MFKSRYTLMPLIVLFVLLLSACASTDVTTDSKQVPASSGGAGLENGNAPGVISDDSLQASVELIGTVEAMSDDVWTVDGQTVIAGPQTAAKDTVTVGSFVKIEAQLAADGLLIASEIELVGDDGNNNTNANANDNDTNANGDDSGNLNDDANTNGSVNDDDNGNMNSDDNANDNDDDKNGNANDDQNDDGSGNQNGNTNANDNQDDDGGNQNGNVNANDDDEGDDMMVPG
jgi:hypothetical protein